ncbi:unnamed protein product [Mytilus coruscus]|uniref:Uncharacterized protein n=1 Tax=Mytilus coruscus TaxID=42192 RepID=A0A6J8DA83_MYTCO|nr:unnamed protein product [Mytilus coruscus]
MLMIKRCPSKSDDKLRNKCENSGEMKTQLLNKPVTSLKSGLTYRNIHCPECFNDSLVNAIIWTIRMECDEKANFNLLSSYSAIIELAEKKQCDLFYHTKSIANYIRSCHINPKNNVDVISTCNVSGTWKTFDRDIEFACQMYDNIFLLFKNVYCYICNPLPENIDMI